MGRISWKDDFVNRMSKDLRGWGNCRWHLVKGGRVYWFLGLLVSSSKEGIYNIVPTRDRCCTAIILKVFMGLKDEYNKLTESLTNIERKMDELTLTRLKLNKIKQGYIYRINALVQACNEAKEEDLLKIYIQHYRDIDKCGINDTIEFSINHYANEYDRAWAEEKDLLSQLEAMKVEQFTKIRKYSSKEDPSYVVAGLLYTGSEETVKGIAEFGNDILDVNSTYIIIKNEDKDPFVFNINTMVYRYNNGKNNIIQSLCFESFMKEFEATD